MNNPKAKIPCHVCNTTGVSKFRGGPCICCHEEGYITPEHKAKLERVGQSLAIGIIEGSTGEARRELMKSLDGR